LIGVLAHSSGLSEYQDESFMGVAASAGFDGTLRPSDQHVHTVVSFLTLLLHAHALNYILLSQDPWAGGTAEDYRNLLIESGTAADHQHHHHHHQFYHYRYYHNHYHHLHHHRATTITARKITTAMCVQV
jgi:hypothetical protein